MLSAIAEKAVEPGILELELEGIAEVVPAGEAEVGAEPGRGADVAGVEGAVHYMLRACTTKPHTYRAASAASLTTAASTCLTRMIPLVVGAFPLPHVGLGLRRRLLSLHRDALPPIVE
jgi:hypothetical protein